MRRTGEFTGDGNMTAPASYRLIRADAGAGIPLADESVDACVTSPPYFGLRRYEGVELTAWPAISFVPMAGLPPITVPAMTACLGLEPDPAAYVAHLMQVFRDVRRVMKDSGVLVLNLGDCYSGGNSGQRVRDNHGGFRDGLDSRTQSATLANPGRDPVQGISPLNLLGIPWRCAFALQADGWLLRSAPPWIKPDNAMPESVQSRPGTAHEMIFMLANGPGYYWDADAIRRVSIYADRARDTPGTRGTQPAAAVNGKRDSSGGVGYHPNGRNWRTADVFMDSLDEAIAFHRGRAAELEAARPRPGLVADADGMPAAHLANPQGFKGSHYATFSPKLVTPWILAATSEAGCCAACGTPHRRAVERTAMVVRPGPKADSYGSRTTDGCSGTMLSAPSSKTLGWFPTCSCPDPGPPCRATVLDPFCGSGSTLVAALAACRNAVGLDASDSYLADARRRLERPHAPLRAPVPAKAGDDLPLFARPGVA